MKDPDLNTLPSCLGLDKADPPNACEKCEAGVLCKQIKRRYIPKAKLQPVIVKIEKILGARA